MRQVIGLIWVAVGLTWIAACDSGDSAPTAPEIPLDQATGFSHAYGMWSPGPQDTCSREIHDGYATVGPDGIVYPTWHPPVDPVTGCTFGHEHGRDPSGSDLFREVGAIPFGYANEHLLASGFGAERHEDHVGHKIEWENDVQMRLGDGGSALFDVTCDILVKLHQGSHSPDAFTNNLHEVVYHIRCSDGTGFSATALTPIGRPGELVASCDRDRRVLVGDASPVISPSGGGRRAIPDAGCLAERVLNADRPRFDSALRESWEINVRLRSESGQTLVAFNPYFQIRDPSRYFDASLERGMGRPVDLCALPELQGRDRCEDLPPESVPWDDVRSPFKGTRRFVDINNNRVDNAGGPNIWYTDPFGNQGSPFPFPGSIRQWVAQHENDGLDLNGHIIGGDRDYDAEGVHAPN